MWISKKKMAMMIEEAKEKEREREQMYRFMDEMHMRMHKMEDKIDELEHIIHSRPVGKKQLNG